MNAMQIVKTFAPDVLDSYFSMIKVLEKRCIFDTKTKELMLIGILVGKQSEHGIDIHVKRAKENGATDEEILTVIVSALPSCGMGAVVKAIGFAAEHLDLELLNKNLKQGQLK